MAISTGKRARKKGGKFICNRYPTDVTVGYLIKGLLYCNKCYEIIKGIRDANGKLRK